MATVSPSIPVIEDASHVVIVDDHPLISESLRLLLNHESTLKVVGVCGDCATAWQMIRELRPHLALVDIDLPDGSGLALAAQIRAAGATPKILILTGNMQLDLAAKAAAAGADGFLLKTTNPVEIVAAVHRVLAGDTFATASVPVLAGSTGDEGGTATPMVPDLHLPTRERQVLSLIVRGMRNKEIAAELTLNVKTVETYRSRLMKRFNCNSPAELVRHAIRTGLVAP